MTIARASRDSEMTSREASGDSETTLPEKLPPTVCLLRYLLFDRIPSNYLVTEVFKLRLSYPSNVSARRVTSILLYIIAAVGKLLYRLGACSSAL